MSGSKPAVTVLGLGAMGMALAEAFLASGHPTTVWNRTPGKADALVARGAARAGTVSEAMAASPLVIVCLLDYRSVHEVLEGTADTPRGRVLVNLTNGTPRQAREMAAAVAYRGADYLDGGIMAVPTPAAAPAVQPPDSPGSSSGRIRHAGNPIHDPVPPQSAAA